MRPLRSFFLALALLLVGVTACEGPSDSRITAPSSQPEALLGLGGATAGPYTLIKDPLLPGLTKAVTTTSLIGINGGSITLLGHTITVPAGAVSVPTLFAVTVLPTGYVEVDLLATVSSVLGLVTDVGSKGFAKPVNLTLTYSRGTNVSDPRKLHILRIKSILGYSKYEVLPSTVNTTAKTVTAPLDHFSHYVLVSD